MWKQEAEDISTREIESVNTGIADFKAGGRGREPRGSQALEAKKGKDGSSTASREKHSPAAALIFIPLRLLYHFRPLTSRILR